MLTRNNDGSKNKEEQIAAEPIAVGETYKQGCDSCDKDVSVHHNDGVPTGDFLKASRAKHADSIHPENCKAFEENENIDPVFEDEIASTDQAEKNVPDLMKQDKVPPGLVDEIYFTAETLEDGNLKMEARTELLLEMRPVIPDGHKNSDIEGIKLITEEF